MLIVDSQVHIWQNSVPAVPTHRQIPSYTADDLLEEMDEVARRAADCVSSGQPAGSDPGRGGQGGWCHQVRGGPRRGATAITGRRRMSLASWRVAQVPRSSAPPRRRLRGWHRDVPPLCAQNVDLFRCFPTPSTSCRVGADAPRRGVACSRSVLSLASWQMDGRHRDVPPATRSSAPPPLAAKGRASSSGPSGQK